MFLEKINKSIFLTIGSVLLFTSCSSYQEKEQTPSNIKENLSHQAEDSYISDAILLTKFNYQIESKSFEKAKVHANKLSSPEGRVVAFLKIALKGKEVSEITFEKEILREAVNNLSSVSDLSKKFVLQQECLHVLLELDPKHKQKFTTEVFTGLLDNFWETSAELESKSIKIHPNLIFDLNEIFNKSWVIDPNALKKSGLEGKICVAKLRHPINPDKSHTELNIVKDEIWEIPSAAIRAPIIIDLIEFELDVTKNIEEARALIKTVKKTLAMISTQDNIK